MEQARESLRASKIMLENDMIKDAINRSYYAVFYALKAVLAIEEKTLNDIKMWWLILIRPMLQRVNFQGI